MMTLKATSGQRQRPKDAKHGAKTIRNNPKTVPNGLKIARKHSDNCMFSDGSIASDGFEINMEFQTLILHVDVAQMAEKCPASSGLLFIS